MMKKTVSLLGLTILIAGFLAAQDVTEDRPVTIPVFAPDSDRFLAAEMQYALSKSPSFFFFDIYGDMFEIPGDLKAPNDSGSDAAVRMAAAVGSIFPITEYLSGMAGVGFVMDNVYMAQSVNFFTGAGLYGHYDPWGIGLGFFGGYYRDSYKELDQGSDGYYRGTIDAQPEQIKDAPRFMIVPKILLSDKIFFLDELGANIGVTEKSDSMSLLSRLAFKALQFGAMRLGINVYYNQYAYNVLLGQRLIGAKFETRYLSIDAGYRQFIDNSGRQFMSNYKDGMYGRIIVKIWPRDTIPIMLSYGLEQTFEMKHFFGLGVSFAPNREWINDLHYELSGVDNMRFIGSNYTSLERYRK
ncbi:MAG: hypothetical protein LBQ55_09730 [Treponema sp.]|jgi:hypothetical protein|nr:hypothetical protein [Treponema sp.]